MLEAKNFQLRTAKDSDLSELFAYFNSIRMKGEYLTSTLLSEQQFKSDFQKTGFWEEERGTLLLARKEKIFGALWFERHSLYDELEIHYYIFRFEDRGKGFMSEALPLFSSYLFATKKIQRLRISVPDYSKAALRIAQKAGFQFEGIARKAFFHRGQYLDLCVYSLLRGEAKGIENIYSHP